MKLRHITKLCICITSYWPTAEPLSDDRKNELADKRWGALWCGTTSEQSHFSSNLSKLRWYSWWGVPSMSLPLGLPQAHCNWEGAQRWTQNSLHSLQLPAGLGAPGAKLASESNRKNEIGSGRKKAVLSAVERFGTELIARLLEVLQLAVFFNWSSNLREFQITAPSWLNHFQSMII